MKRIALFLGVLAVLETASASWYWPFGDDDDKPRVSELMREATRLIDEATEMTATNNVDGAVAKYQEALRELERVEGENPDRAASTEFSSLRNKRAYVNAAIDTLRLAEARENARAIAVTDTKDLEEKFTSRHNIMRLEKRLEKDPKDRKARLALIGEFIGAEKYPAALWQIETILQTSTNDPSALNLRAICEASQGKLKEAEETLYLSIKNNPRDYNGYYNMANLKLSNPEGRDAAKLYYETGRRMGGPRDNALEEAFK